MSREDVLRKLNEIKDREEYAREMSIGFNNFVQKGYTQVWCGINMGKYYPKGEDIMTATNVYTTDQLYTKYLETLNKRE